MLKIKYLVFFIIIESNLTFYKFLIHKVVYLSNQRPHYILKKSKISVTSLFYPFYIYAKGSVSSLFFNKY